MREHCDWYQQGFGLVSELRKLTLLEGILMRSRWTSPALVDRLPQTGDGPSRCGLLLKAKNRQAQQKSLIIVHTLAVLTNQLFTYSQLTTYQCTTVFLPTNCDV